MQVRTPYVAGTFYPAEAEELKSFCQTLLGTSTSLIEAKAVILPHAGYVYSGKTAAAVLSRVHVPDRVILLGPNHSGRGADFALSGAERWQSPLGEIPIDQIASADLILASDEMKWDDGAHQYEHSLEVELPFLQIKNQAVKIIPILVGTLDLIAARQVAVACGRFLAQSEGRTLVVVSSDMSHYEPDTTTREKDRYALAAIEHLDEEAFLKAVRLHRVTMCGMVPVYMLLSMKEILGITKATLVDYRTSADATGDTDRVVGYAGFIFE